MSRSILLAFLLLSAPAVWSGSTAVHVFPDKVEGHVSPMLYGHFLEHIYDSVVGGLDGQLLRGPSFEEPPGLLPNGWEVIQGGWSLEDLVLVNDGVGPDAHILKGDPSWTDYEFSVRAKKDSGAEGFLIIFRAVDSNNFYWWNLGGWNNTQSAVEHEVNGARSLVAGTNQPVKIETGREYLIRVACQGSQIECFLDGGKVCAFEDTSNGHGRVGLGTWVTAARYWDVRVKKGSETLLGTEMPSAGSSLSRLWKSDGEKSDVHLQWSSENPLNSRHCQRLGTSGKGGGLLQEGLPVQEGQTYTGSVWVRGSAEKFIVALKAGGDILSASYMIESQDWIEVPFEFTPRMSDCYAIFHLYIQGAGNVFLDQCTLRRKDTRYRPAIYDKVREISPAFIRWPGGCFAEYYRWQDGIGPLKDRITKPNTVWGGFDPNHIGTDEFIQLCRDVKAEPLIVLNIGHHDPPEKVQDYIQEALAWEEYCNGAASTKYGAIRASNGHPEPYGVKYWEIGNETWPMGAEAYAQRVVQFVEALRQQNPGLKFLVCGSGGHNLEWNQKILELAATHMDYLSVHHYMQGTFEEEMKNGVEYPAFLEKTGEIIKTCAHPEIRIAVTEWNQQSIALRTGLYAGLVLNGFERLGDLVTLSCPALFIRKTSFSEWNNAFINHDSNRVFVAPNYLVMKLYNDHFAPLRIAAEAPAGLNMVATRNETPGEIILKVVNPSAAESIASQIVIEGQGAASSLHLWRVTSEGIDDQNSLEEPERIKVQEEEVAGSEIVFPAHSVTVIAVPWK